MYTGYGGCVNEVSGLRKINVSSFHSSIHLPVYCVLISSTYQMAVLAVSVRDTELNETQPSLPSKNPQLGSQRSNKYLEWPGDGGAYIVHGCTGKEWSSTRARLRGGSTLEKATELDHEGWAAGQMRGCSKRKHHLVCFVIASGLDLGAGVQ